MKVERDADWGDPSLEHLRTRLAALEDRVRSAVARRQAVDPDPGDPFRGLYVSHAQADRLVDGAGWPDADPSIEVAVAGIETSAGSANGSGVETDALRLPGLARSFDLDLLDTEILLVALAPDLDPRFERLYGYLHDDVTRRRASVGLALELCGLAPTSAAARARLSPRGLVVRAGLVVVEDRERPTLSRSVRVPDRITAYLLGDDAPPEELADVLEPTSAPESIARSHRLEQALSEGIGLVYLREAGMASGVATAVASLHALGASALTIDLTRLARAADPRFVAASAVREARLSRRALVAGPLEALPDRSPEVIRLIAESRWPTVLAGEPTWDPAWSRAVPLLLDAPQPTRAERMTLWRHAVNGHGESDRSLAEMLEATMAFRLDVPQMTRAAQAGLLRARAEKRAIEPDDLLVGARAQSAAGLDRLARRMVPRADWDHLVVPRDARAQLRQLAARARNRERVLDEWGIGGRSSRGRGITALFAGESGTGKTLAAEVIAAELGLDLYVIDLSTVVDKYIGETEKNLDRIFVEADRVNGVLLFDEADAIFGKRSDVRDARDRYANVEVAYLLQRMERFDGLAVLTTNLRANLDDAFTRRIDVIVDFPMPDEGDRLALWRMHLPAQLPQEGDIDVAFLARRFRISGGNIRNICLTAAFLAAEAGAPVTMADLIRGTEQEYRKLGRLTPEAEFGPYHAMLMAEAGNDVPQ